MNKRSIIIALVACVLTFAEPSPCSSNDDAAAPTYVTSAACATCHPEQHEAWQGSHHDLAMAEANEASVLGDFNNTTLAHHESSSRFFKKDSVFMVETDDVRGKAVQLPIRYTFGTFPLQQYLVEGKGGRLQVLATAWDSRPASEGGQRWFHLVPGESGAPGEVLHWSGRGQTWNSMCADCHSTNLVRGYDAANNTWDTRWSDIDVGCEACHGPGSAHVSWAKTAANQSAETDADADSARNLASTKGLTVDLRGDRGADDNAAAQWIMNPSTGIAARSKPLTSRQQLETCAPCHSRRTKIDPDAVPGQAMFDGYLPSLVSRGLYRDDGQMLEEVYVYGSFTQSAMFQAGVRCSDCHDPHALSLGENPSAVCSKCHATEKFATTTHHHHAPGSPGAQCVACHMPTVTYMEVDERHDHSFRVPRPDLSVAIGTPNACNDCHAAQTPKWAAAAIREWIGEGEIAGTKHAETLALGRSIGLGDAGALGNQSDAADRPAEAPENAADNSPEENAAEYMPGLSASPTEKLRGLTLDPSAPPILRATALTDWAAQVPRPDLATLKTLAGDEAAPLRWAVATTSYLVAPEQRLQVLEPLLDDSMLAVRIEAARALAGTPSAAWTDATKQSYEKALGEYREAQLANAHDPGAHVNLAGLEIDLGDLKAATDAFTAALQREGRYVPAFVGLAEVHRLRGDDDIANRVLRMGLVVVPEELSGDLHHALGLVLTRLKRPEDALTQLELAVKYSPTNSRYRYVYAVALSSAKRIDEALDTIDKGLEFDPGARNLLTLGVSLNMDRRKPEAALAYAKRILRLNPADAQTRGFIEELERRGAAAKTE